MHTMIRSDLTPDTPAALARRVRTATREVAEAAARTRTSERLAHHEDRARGHVATGRLARAATALVAAAILREVHGLTEAPANGAHVASFTGRGVLLGKVVDTCVEVDGTPWVNVEHADGFTWTTAATITVLA